MGPPPWDRMQVIMAASAFEMPHFGKRFFSSLGKKWGALLPEPPETKKENSFVSPLVPTGTAYLLSLSGWSFSKSAIRISFLFLVSLLGGVCTAGGMSPIG